MTDHSIPLAMLIDGARADSDRRREVVNPANGAVAASMPEASLDQLESAVAAARHARGTWAADAALRTSTLRAMAGIVTDHRDDLARMLSLETGLPFRTAQDEVGMAAMFLKYRSASVPAIDSIHDDERQRVEVVRRPSGTVGAIVPWNAPMMIACEKIGTAFAAGNTVVLKPSPMAPMTLLLLGGLVQSAVPAGVLNIVTGGDDLGTALVAHRDVTMISFTGSTAAGRAIMAGAAPTLKRLSLELGGNDAAIVLPDIDLRKVATKLFFGAFYRGGQVCAAIKRLYVHRSIHDPLVSALTQLAERTVPGDPFDETTTMGPLSNRQQFEKVKALVAASLEAGGTLVTGGTALDRPGYFFPPTLVTTGDADNPLVSEEQFGPALPIIAFDDIYEAVQAANATDFGLGGSVWTSDIEHGVALARRLEAGSVWVNRHGIVMPDTPFGGMKQSGIGRANGQAGLDACCELQTISVALPRMPT